MEPAKLVKSKLKINWLGPKGKVFKQYRNRILNNKVESPVRTA